MLSEGHRWTLQLLKRKLTIEEVAVASTAAFTRLKADLPEEIAERLKTARVAYRHGTDVRIFQYNAWDAHQPGVLDRKHINYSVIYDPHCKYHGFWRDQELPCNLFCRFYVNKQRVYDKSDLIVRALWDEMQKAERILYGWRARRNDQIIALMHPFEAAAPAELEEAIFQSFLELIPYWHPVYATFCDQYGVNLRPAAVQNAIASRVKFQPRGPRERSLAEYVRHVPRRLRTEVFKRDGFRCVKCGCDDAAILHADHILPVALGGTTVLENLQTMCGPCNLGKGAREQVDYRTPTKTAPGQECVPRRTSLSESRRSES